MAAEIFNISSIESFGLPNLSIYPVPVTDYPEISYENTLIDLDEKKIKFNFFDECTSTSNDINLIHNSHNDDIQDFLKEFLLIRTKDIEPNSDEGVSRIADYEIVEMKTESNGSPLLSNTSGQSTSPEIVVPETSTDHTVTPLNWRQQRYRCQPPQICDICGKTFKAPHHLRRHRFEKHTALSPEKFAYPCQQCDKRFKRLEHLRLHQRLKHSNLKDYKCETCGKGFATKNQLSRHLLRHEREKNVAICKGCGRVFARRGNLVKHEANKCEGNRAPGA